MRRTPVLWTVAGLIATTLAAAPAEARPTSVARSQSAGVQEASAPQIAWGPCDPDTAQVSPDIECGQLKVPLDHARPGGTKITLALSRIRHTVPAESYQGVMLTNPGGPGGSGLWMPVIGQFVPKSAGQAYDWIGFDPRGVGRSSPSLSCDENYFGYDRPPYVPTSTAIERSWLERTERYAQACAEAAGPLLDNLRTVDTVKDMELIRKALAAARLNFYGFSYGTTLGQVYATMHPERVRRMVLDSNVDPRGLWYENNLDQNRAFDRNIEVFFDWVAKHDAVYHLGTSGEDVAALYYEQLRKLRATPAGGLIGPAEWNEIFIPAAYSVFTWTEVARVFDAWVNQGDAAALKEFYDMVAPKGPGADNGYAIYLAVQCTDARWPQKWSTWKADAWRIHEKDPFVTWANTWYNAPCLFWEADAGQPPKVGSDDLRTPPLLIGETLDAATPFAGNLEVRRRFPGAVLIEGVGGTTHAASLFGVACVDNRIATYLAIGHLPERRSGQRADVQCPPVPQPEPETAGPATSGVDLARLWSAHLR